MKMKACRMMIWDVEHCPTPGQDDGARRVNSAEHAEQPQQHEHQFAPAYMLPNNRMPSDTGLATSSMMLIARFGNQRTGFEPKGAVKSSWTKPPTPLALKLK